MNAGEIDEAIEANQLQKVKDHFAEHPEDLSQNDLFGTWLHVAAEFGHLEMIEYFIEAGVDVNEEGGILESGPLKVAASDGHIKAVQLLIQKGARLDSSEPEKNPLFGAIYGGHKDIAKLLLDRGIDASAVYNGKNMKNMDAIAYAEEQGEPEIAAMIREHLGK